MYALCIEDDVDGQGECRLLPGGGEDGGALHQGDSTRRGGDLKQQTNIREIQPAGQGRSVSILTTSFGVLPSALSDSEA